MTFLNQDSLEKEESSPALSQRGRAGLEFLGSVQTFSSSTVRSHARDDFESDPEGKALIETWQREGQNEPWPDMVDKAAAVARRYPNYRLERFLQRYVAEEVYLRGVPAVEERRHQFESLSKAPSESTIGSLELDGDTHMPEYYDGVEWHLEPGGWDGYDLYGPFFTYVARTLHFQTRRLCRCGAGGRYHPAKG